MTSLHDDDVGGVRLPQEWQTRLELGAGDSVRLFGIVTSTGGTTHLSKRDSGMMNFNATRSSSSGKVSHASKGPR